MKLRASRFTEEWNSSSCLGEFCAKTGYSPSAAAVRACLLRRRGMVLKRFHRFGIQAERQRLQPEEPKMQEQPTPPERQANPTPG